MWGGLPMVGVPLAPLSAATAALRAVEGRGKGEAGGGAMRRAREEAAEDGDDVAEEENMLRRKMRRELRSVKERVAGQREEFVSLESGAAKVEETLAALNAIRSGKENLVKPRELACDTEVLTQVADFALEFAKQLRDDTMSDITPAGLVAGLAKALSLDGGAGEGSRLGGRVAGSSPSSSSSSSFAAGSLSWAALGEQLCAPLPPPPSSSSSTGMPAVALTVPRLSRVPAVGFNPMLGPLEVELKESVGQRGPRGARQKLGALERPDALAGEDVGEGGKTEMDTNMDLMYQHLRRLTKDPGLHGPTVFDRFLVNPDSFSETVENCFMLSFLVKQGRASLQPDERGGGEAETSEAAEVAAAAAPGVQRAAQLKVGAARPPSAQEYADAGVANAQFCMRLDYAQWVALSRRLEAERDVLASVRPPRCKDAKLASLGRGAGLNATAAATVSSARLPPPHPRVKPERR